jgi:RimJ/RimL family protein N-acetyltransferase
MSEPFLRTASLDLRPLEPSDADGPYLEWFNDAEVCQYNSHFVFPYRREDALTYIAMVGASRSELVFAIVERASKKHIGNIALSGIDFINRSAEFAIVIGDRSIWGKGYSKEAGSALVNHAFTVLNLHRVYCGTTADNQPMRRLALFLGMKEEGLRRDALYKSGRYVDVVEYGVIRSEFFMPQADESRELVDG